MSATYSTAPQMKLIPREHFWVSGIKRGFELSALLPLYVFVRDNLTKLEKRKDMEFTIGSSTIVYEISENNDIHLITGWNGVRK